MDVSVGSICVGGGVGVSGMISLVAARQAKVEERSVKVKRMVFRLRFVICPLFGEMDPACIECVKIKVSDQEQNPAQHLQTLHQGFERKGKIFLNGLDDVLEIVEFGLDAFLPVLEIELVVDGFIKFGGIPIADEEQVLFHALEVEHHFEFVFCDLADHAACGAWTAFVQKKGFVDLIEQVFDGYIQHAITQQLIVADLEQDDIGLKVVVGSDNDSALPIHQCEFAGRVTGTRS